MSTSFEPKKGRELLKPPEITPVLTIILMLICAFNSGKGEINWLFSHSISGQSLQAALSAAPTPTVANTAAAPTPAQPNKGGNKGGLVVKGGPQPAGGAAAPTTGLVYFLTQVCTFNCPKLSLVFPDNGIANFVEAAWTSATGQITIWIMLVNILYIWLFGSILEKRLIQWRYFAFLASAVIVPAIIVLFTSPPGSAEFSQKIVGPTLMTCFLLGGYMAFMPKKPWSPQEWKPPRWKVFKGNDEKDRTMLKVPWVNPWTYVIGFILWTALQQAFFMFGRADVVNFTHQVMAGDLYSTLTGGSVSGGTINVITLIPGIISVIAGAIFSQLYLWAGTSVRYKRQASDLQVQAVLQYKELRALDMNHTQALEGTSKLIGVPLDICKDWINKGMQPIKDEN